MDEALRMEQALQQFALLIRLLHSLVTVSLVSKGGNAIKI
jgi:hypothetical protein